MFSFFTPAALKRSFEIEDVDDIPSFSSTSPISTPITPSSSHFFLNHNKATEGQGGDGQSPSLAFNNNNNNLGSSAHHSCISLGSSPSPVLKSRTVVSSLSFNRGTMNKQTIHHNGSSVTRASSFQSRLNPNSYSMLSGPSSDNDSLHSSTSSLEYSGGGGGALPLSKLGSYPNPPSQVEYHRTQPKLPQQHLGGDANLIINHRLKKFSSHGSVFPTEMDKGPGMMLGVPQPLGVNHGSMPSLDLQIRDGGGGIVGMQRGGGRVSPGLRYANVTWNGHLHNDTSFGVEGNCGSKNPCQQQSPTVPKAPQPKVKEIPRLNKFPLDLDNLVSSTSKNSAMKANPPKPHPRSTGDLQYHTSPPPTSASPSASLSSLDGSSDTLPNPFLSFSKCPPTRLQGSIPVTGMSCSPIPLTSAQSPQLEAVSGPQISQMFPILHGPYSSSNPSSPRAIRSLKNSAVDARESVGSILQRIASFSCPVTSDTTQAAVTQHPTAQSNGWLSSPSGCPTVTLPSRIQGKKTHAGKNFFLQNS